MADIEVASLNRTLNSLNGQINALATTMEGVHEQLDNSIHTVGNEINTNIVTSHNTIKELISDFHSEFNEFVDLQKRANRFQIAETRLVKIRQELDKKFGHYDIVRRTATGILQADDLEIVKTSTIANVTEELMITTPNYWLAPCLVALAAWINDQKDVAERALKEGIHRDDEKTSLLFGLICRRANRLDVTLKWVKRYLENQDEEDLDRKTVIILDAYTSGLFGKDSDGIIASQINDWMENLNNKPNFVNEQTKQWSDAINLMKRPISSYQFPYLRKYSQTTNELIDVLERANLNSIFTSYLKRIFSANEPLDSLKGQLDEILNSLVTDYDDEELPLRKSEKLEQFVVNFEGDEKRAIECMQLENTAFETHKNFTQLLTDAAMNPELSHAKKSTQKFAISLSKEWIKKAYQGIIDEYNGKIPKKIDISIDTFKCETTYGQNEDELINQFNELIKKERHSEWMNIRISAFTQFCLFGGIAIIIIGIAIAIIPALSSIMPIGVISSIAGIGMVINYLVKSSTEKRGKARLNAKYTEKKKKGIEILRATLAEVVDYWQEFKQKDDNSKEVITFLDQITPDQYVKQLTNQGAKKFEKVELYL